MGGLSVAAKNATRKAGLDDQLVELVNLRISQINGCAYCLQVHTATGSTPDSTPSDSACWPPGGRRRPSTARRSEPLWTWPRRSGAVEQLEARQAP
ncbi:carboxymuconolactone decarboxylase family protein [Citricoccus sp.]|uniref:carboxymuconolactone decarboxylase family protein n=1 Tax=Citricoccus sp. TaxID=1978372 RepID=UPI0028BD2DC7|nr:carboxymuconolactone decarboxylase family protein [Citricoccus sp.]